METPETLCMLVLKLLNGVADTWNRKSLMLRRSKQSGPPLKDFIEFFEEEIILVNDPIFSREAKLHMLELKGSLMIKEKEKQ